MKIQYNISAIIIWSLVLLLPILITGTGSLLLCAILVLSIACAGLLGSILLNSINAFRDFLSISFSGMSVFTGSLFMSLLVFIPGLSQMQLFAGVFVFFLVLLLLCRKNISLAFAIDKADIIAFIFGFILMLAISLQEDLARALSAIPVRLADETLTDAHFFTAVVTSIRHGSIFNAAYEINSPVNYHCLAFFIPAFWANLLNISSHQALWGLAMTFYKILTFLLGYELLYYFFKDKIAKGVTWFIVLAMLFPIVLAPLHPLYLMKLEFHNFVFSGMSYILPGGNPSFTFSFPLSLMILIMFYDIDWQKGSFSYSKMLFAILLGALVIGKLPLYFVIMAFLSIIILKRLILDRAKLTWFLPSALISLIFAGVLYKVFLTAKSDGVLSIKFGYLIQAFGEMMHRPFDTPGRQIFISVCIVAIFLLWIGIRLVGLWGLYRSGNTKLKELATGSIFAFLACVVVSLFLHMDHVDQYGHVLREGTFDVLQFIRASFYLLTVAAGAGMMYLFLNFNAKPYYKRPLVYVSALWFSCALIALIANMRWEQPLKTYTWFNENYHELKTGKYNDGLITVNPFQKFHGIMLSSSDLGTYWTAMGQANGCYNGSIKNQYRWEIFKDVLQKQDTVSLTEMKKEGVKYIFSVPEDSAVFANIAYKYPNSLQKVAGTSWIYVIN